MSISTSAVDKKRSAMIRPKAFATAPCPVSAAPAAAGSAAYNARFEYLRPPP